MSHENNTKPTIAAFDFDGTITNCDSLLPFLFYTTGYMKSLVKLFLVSPTLLSYCINITSRQRTKECVLSKFFKGLSQHELQQLGKNFAASNQLARHMKPAALKRIAWHQKQGHRCILISASINIYLDPWSKQMGFDDLICSRLELDQNHKITGHLQGLNCWGEEKTRRLTELLGPKSNYILYAYGDSKGDEALLAMADYAYLKWIP